MWILTYEIHYSEGQQSKYQTFHNLEVMNYQVGILKNSGLISKLRVFNVLEEIQMEVTQ